MIGIVMKRVFVNTIRMVLMAVMLLSSHAAMAKEVTTQQALAAAKQFITTNGRHLSATKPLAVAWNSSALHRGMSTAATESPTFYVVEIDGGHGFVVVAGDDTVQPILAYSFSHAAPEFDNSDRYCNVRGWFIATDETIRAARKAAGAQDSRWANVASTRAVTTVIETALWDQSAPYNLECPTVAEGQCLTGCTQTASAIIMYHHRWPLAATGTTKPYTTTTYEYNIPGRNINHTYDWDNMLFSYSDDYTAEQGQAIATLMSDLGHANMADYGVLETGALPNPVTMHENFGYSPNMALISRKGFTHDEWFSMIRAEIDANNPVFYSGYNEAYTSGHAFVIDGYSDSDYFHINWGWSGNFNGFFTLDNMRPIEEYDFSYEQWMLANFTPYRGGVAEGQLMMYPQGIVHNVEAFEVDVPFAINSVTFCNISQKNFSGEVALCHTDSSGVIKEVVSNIETVPDLPPGYAGVVSDVACLIKLPIAPNDRLRYFYRTDESDSWHLLKPYCGPCLWEIVLNEQGQATIEESTSLHFDKLTHTLTINHSPSVNATVLVGGTVPAGGVSYQTGIVTIDTTKFVGKECLVRMKRGEELKEFTFNIQPIK